MEIILAAGIRSRHVIFSTRIAHETRFLTSGSIAVTHLALAQDRGRSLDQPAAMSAASHPQGERAQQARRQVRRRRDLRCPAPDRSRTAMPRCCVTLGARIAFGLAPRQELLRRGPRRSPPRPRCSRTGCRRARCQCVLQGGEGREESAGFSPDAAASAAERNASSAVPLFGGGLGACKPRTASGLPARDRDFGSRPR
jgi:hypothetical protein